MISGSVRTEQVRRNVVSSSSKLNESLEGLGFSSQRGAHNARTIKDIKKRGARVLRDKPTIKWNKDPEKERLVDSWLHLGPR